MLIRSRFAVSPVGATNAHELRHGSVNEAKQLVARQIAKEERTC